MRRIKRARPRDLIIERRTAPLEECLLSELYRLVAKIKHLYLSAGEKWSPQAKRDEMQDPGLAYVIARSGGRLAGFVAFKDGFIWELHVNAQFKRQGLGRRLLLLAAAASGGQPVSLRAFECNKPALALYRSAGFAVESSDAGAVIMTRSDVQVKRA